MTTRILLIETDPKLTVGFEQALRAAGFAVLGTVPLDQTFESMRKDRPAALVARVGRLEQQDASRLVKVARRCSRPVVVFASQPSEAVVLKALHGLVSVYAFEPLTPAAVHSAITTSLSHFHVNDTLRQQLETTRQRMRQRKTLDRAKYRLMEQHGIGEQAAYDQLRKLAMDRRQSLYNLACEILEREASADSEESRDWAW